MKMNKEFGEVAFLQSPKPLEKLKKIMPDKKSPYNTEAVQQIIKKMSQAKNDVMQETTNVAKPNHYSSTKQLNYNQSAALQEGLKSFGQSARNIQGALKNNFVNRLSGKDEQLQNENVQTQIRLKNNSALFQTAKIDQNNGPSTLEEPQLSHRGQNNEAPLKLQQKIKQKQENQNLANISQAQNAVIETITNQNNMSNSNVPSNFVSQNFIQMLQMTAQRKNRVNQGIQNPQVLANSNSNQAKSLIQTQNSTLATTQATSHTSNQFYTLEEQQNNNPTTQIFASSSGFNSPNNNFSKKFNSQIASVNSSKILPQKKLFETSGSFQSNFSNPGQQKKSNSLQRQINNQKIQQNQNPQTFPIKNTQSHEYFSKSVQNNKGKEFNQTESTPKQDYEQLYCFQDGLLYNSQQNQQQINNQDKADIEKEIEEEYLNNIKQINKDIISKKKIPEDKTNQFLNFIPKSTTISNQLTIKNDSALFKKSTDKKQMFLTQQQFGSSYNHEKAQKQINEQPSSAKKIKPQKEIPVYNNTANKKRESFEVTMTRTGSEFYKSSSLNKNDKKNQLNTFQAQKSLNQKPVASQIKKPESPLKQSQQKQKTGIKNIFSSSTKVSSSLTSSLNSSKKAVNQLSKEVKNKQQLELSLKALASINQTTSILQSKKQSDEIQIPQQIQQDNQVQNGLSQYVSQVKPQQMQQYLSYPRNDYIDKIDNVDVELKLSKKSSFNAENRSSQNDKALQLSDLDTVQNEILHRKNRIETPISLGFCYYNTSMDMHNRYPNQDDYFCNIYREHFVQSFNALNFCRSLEPIDPLVLESKLIELPLNPNKKKTIIFDLDETLIHCNEDPNVYSDVVISVTFPNGELVQAGINIRPYAKECLKELSKYFEIIVFTASHSCYAERVIEYLDPNRQYINYVLSRDNCVMTKEGVHIKDLRIFKNRELKNIVIVDNAAYSFGFQIENGIPIIPFFENKKDMELKFLTDFLKKLLDKDDVRVFIHKTFKLNIYQECESVEEALERVYGIKQNDQIQEMENNQYQQMDEDMYYQQQNQQYNNQKNNSSQGEDNPNEEDEDDDLERDEADVFEDSNQDIQPVLYQQTQQMSKNCLQDNNNNQIVQISELELIKDSNN
ncbi:NLI interacting factor-like phosphatase (macronuclear) [Tetrahymena thermophila SB210]|uniref:NLI interacting factor-like phosphatase n=1 Tax=Tetrahymena thermophila (strain SB210) TaxID=312017 RepID=I7LXX6_TETTS|nr:NLI interacting factor-like phosphatase [Tetrahymena thermophila SB210]EAS06725.2 NLI interacting factor-like phosphatase [Tetrahymena thermophila SB210]|eukprot:XP_001026967.2 NLI interacting factor-like phosphatase [Tetrahymena thermophila SB210]